MESNFMYVQNEIDFDYSFRKQFNNWGLFKKFIAIVFLPFVPIYSVSKGFQMRKWKKYGGNYPPGMTKYVILMAVAYYFTVFPMLIGLFWVLFQLYLFWLSFIIAFYLNRKDLEEIDKDLIVETEDFKLIGLSFIWIFIFFLNIWVILGIYFYSFTFYCISCVIPLALLCPKRIIIPFKSIYGFFKYTAWCPRHWGLVYRKRLRSQKINLYLRCYEIHY